MARVLLFGMAVALALACGASGQTTAAPSTMEPTFPPPEYMALATWIPSADNKTVHVHVDDPEFVGTAWVLTEGTETCNGRGLLRASNVGPNYVDTTVIARLVVGPNVEVNATSIRFRATRSANMSETASVRISSNHNNGGWTVHAERSNLEVLSNICEDPVMVPMAELAMEGGIIEVEVAIRDPDPMTPAGEHIYIEFLTIFGTVRAVNCPNNCSATGYCSPTYGHCICDPGYGTIDCSVGCPHYINETIQCNGHGTCMDTIYGDGTCSCETGWYTEDCSVSNCGSSCANGGVCNSTTGICACPPGGGWSGARCGTCDGFFGENCDIPCSECNEAGSVCDEGVHGGCLCTPGTAWTGDRCEICPYCLEGEGGCDGEEFFFGPNCNESCADCLAGMCVGGVNGGCSCNTTDAGWVGPLCDQCPPGTGYRGPACNISCDVCRVDEGHFCDDGLFGTGCVCGNETGLIGEFCTTCVPGFKVNTTRDYLCDQCAPGTFSTSFNASACTDCPLGMYQDEWGKTSCKACPPGRFGDELGLPECSLCNPGTASNEYNRTECDPCELGQYSDTFGKLSCVNCRMGLVGNASDLTQCYKCPGGAFTNSSGATACTLCADGTFLGKPSPLTPVGATACLKCDRWLSCSGLGTVVPRWAPGYYNDDGTPIECDVVDACADGRCTIGYTDYACSSCEFNTTADIRFYRLQYKCEECPDNPGWILGGFLLATTLVIVVIVLVGHRYRDRLDLFSTSGFFSSVIIAWNFLQILSLLANIDADWPSLFIEALEELFIFNLSPDTLAADCSVQLGYTTKFTLIAFLPLICILALFVPWFVVFVSSFSQSPRMDDALERSKPLLSSTINTVAQFMLLIFIFLCSTFLSYFDCFVTPQGTWLMRGNSSFECFGGDWWRFFAVAFLAIVVYLIVLPAGVAYVLYGNRNKLDRRITLLRYGLLYIRYKPTRYYWELVVLARKFLTVAAISFLQRKSLAVETGSVAGVEAEEDASASIGQIVGVFVVAVIFTVLHFVAWPYSTNRHNVFEGVLYVVFDIILLFSILFFVGAIGSVTLTVIAFSIIGIIAVYMLVSIITDIQVICCEDAKKPVTDEGDENSSKGVELGSISDLSDFKPYDDLTEIADNNSIFTGSVIPPGTSLNGTSELDISDINDAFDDGSVRRVSTHVARKGNKGSADNDTTVAGSDFEAEFGDL